MNIFLWINYEEYASIRFVVNVCGQCVFKNSPKCDVIQVKCKIPEKIVREDVAALIDDRNTR